MNELKKKKNSEPNSGSAVLHCGHFHKRAVISLLTWGGQVWKNFCLHGEEVLCPVKYCQPVFLTHWQYCMWRRALHTHTGVFSHCGAAVWLRTVGSMLRTRWNSTASNWKDVTGATGEWVRCQSSRGDACPHTAGKSENYWKYLCGLATSVLGLIKM